MRILITFIVSVYFLHGTSAQDLKLGVRGGLQMSNQRIEAEIFDILNYDFDTQALIGWQLGVEAEIPLNQDLSVQAALLLTRQGFYFEDRNALLDIEIRSKPLYLTLPLPLVYRTQAAGIQVFAGLGPYLSLGVGGSTDSEGDLAGLDFAEDGAIKWGNDRANDNYRALDWGSVLTAGVKRENLQFALSYYIGLANIYPEPDKDHIIRNRMLSLSTTYFLK
ncbi:MAG: outer membrane beta-barrel protein [Cyclobacteriaceae bacterium]